MDPLVQAAEDALLVHPHPALRLQELARLLTERIDRSLTEERLRTVLDRYPERFRVLDAWRGQRSVATGARPGPATRTDAWVIALGDGPERACGARAPDVRLRESVRWFARAMDGRSILAAGRWYAVVMEERDARPLVGRQPARRTRRKERRAS